MIERKIVQMNSMEFGVSSYIRKTLNDVPIKDIIFEKHPMGERITIYTSAPGLVIGRQGSNIKKLTIDLKKEFNFENPQVKIGEVDNMFLSAKIVAKRIVNSLENFGSKKFRLSGFKALQGIMDAGAMGCEIRISGKLPSSRSKSWRFNRGYLKKTGYVSDFLIDHAIDHVTLKTGVVGIKVSIMLPNTPLPDKIKYLEEVIDPVVKEELEKVAKKDEATEKMSDLKEDKKVTDDKKKSVAKKSSKDEVIKKEVKSKEEVVKE